MSLGFGNQAGDLTFIESAFEIAVVGSVEKVKEIGRNYQNFN